MLVGIFPFFMPLFLNLEPGSLKIKARFHHTKPRLNGYKENLI